MNSGRYCVRFVGRAQLAEAQAKVPPIPYELYDGQSGSATTIQSDPVPCIYLFYFLLVELDI